MTGLMPGIYGTLLLSGVLVSVGHGLGMCGPLSIVIGLRPLPTSRLRRSRHVWYHAARIGVYTVLGAIAGAIGSFLGLGVRLRQMAVWISLALGIGVVLLAMGYLDRLPLRLRQVVGTRLTRAMSKALARGDRTGVVLLGALNALLPCGLVYGVLLLSASIGGPLRAAGGMLLFGLGTVPALVLVGWGALALSVRTRQALTRGRGIVMLLVGAQLSLRAPSVLGVAPHWRVGGLVIW